MCVFYLSRRIEVSRRGEMPQHGNVSTRKWLKKKRKPLKNRFFLRRFCNFCKKNGNPSKPSFWGVPLYFEAFLKIFEGFPLFTWQLFLRIFPIFFWGISQYFWGIFAKFLRRFPFLKTWLSWGVSSFFWDVSVFFFKAFPFFEKV